MVGEESPKKLDFVDALRGIAVLLVIGIHTLLYTNNYLEIFPPKMIEIFTMGNRGVQLFYMMSAFTLFYSYKFRKEEKNKNLNFFIRRFFRIAPMFYVAILIYPVILDYLVLNRGIDIMGIFLSATFLNAFVYKYLNGITPGGWSIQVEMLFYCFIPLLANRINNLNNAIRFFLSSLLFSILLPNIISRTIGSQYTDVLFHSLLLQMPYFALGIILYFIYFESKKLKILKPDIVIIILILLISLSIYIFKYLDLNLVNVLAILMIVIYCMFYPAKLFNNVITRYIGRVSYSIYLLHFLVLFVIQKINLFPTVDSLILNILIFVLRYIIATVISVLLSTITINTIEKPGQNIGKKIISNLNKDLKLK